MTLALAGVRVVAVEQFGAGPWATLQLADLGAEVIKIEDPTSGGDVGRYVPPFQEGEDSLFFETFNRGKQSVSLDLRHPGARPVLEDLVRASDVVYSNLRGDQPAKLGLRYADLCEVNPRIVCCSLSGFGMTGPRAGRGRLRLHDAGARGLDEPDRRARRTADEERPLARRHLGGLRRRARAARAACGARGATASAATAISLFETALAGAHVRRHLGGDGGLRAAAPGNSAHPSIVPFQNFADRRRLDRRRLPEGEVLAAAVRCASSDRSSLGDERFANFAARDQHRDELLEILDAIFARRTTVEWLRRLTELGIPCAPINDVLEALTDPQAVAREDVVEAPHDRFGTVRTIASAVRVADERRPVVPARAAASRRTNA